MKVEFKGQTYFISWKHLREEKPDSTHCVIRLENEDLISVGVAICSPKDNFFKFLGRKISLKHALKEDGLTKEFKRACWDQFIKENKKKIKKN